MNTEATVQLLTAEVRTLMVGSRQVTLSVAKQLDRVSLEKVEPFGRVRIGDIDNVVIGRSKVNGSLVVAKFTRARAQPYVDPEDFDDFRVTTRPIVCAALGSGRDECFNLKWCGYVVNISESLTTRCDLHKRYGPAECDHWDVNGCNSVFANAVERADATNRINRAAADLPLIVLAGLR